MSFAPGNRAECEILVTVYGQGEDGWVSGWVAFPRSYLGRGVCARGRTLYGWLDGRFEYPTPSRHLWRTSWITSRCAFLKLSPPLSAQIVHGIPLGTSRRYSRSTSALITRRVIFVVRIPSSCLQYILRGTASTPPSLSSLSRRPS